MDTETVMRRRQLTRGLWILGVALAVLSVACVSARPVETGEPATAPPEATPTVAPQPTSPPATPTPTPPPTATATPTPEPTPTPAPEPYDGDVVSMRLPSLGVEAPIERIGLVEGENKLDVPEPHNIGWYEIYDKPGFGTSSLFTAHRDYYPRIRGPFYSLTEIKDGDPIVVVMDDGREYVYEVFFQKRYAVEDVPVGYLLRPHEHEDPAMRRPANEEWIVLYTCGGEFVARTPGGPGYYLHRDVVIGRLVETVLPTAVRAADDIQQ